jgi:hypothetical protein
MHHLPWATAFAVAMGFLEAAVVVYLRALYYPDGFRFPLVPMPGYLVVTELVREAATLVMLLAPGALVTRLRLERFAWFCWCFAIWDLCYYLFLKLVLGWPETWMTWDVLFLLPVVWCGPVLAPCLISVGLLVLAVLLLEQGSRAPGRSPAPWQWILWIVAACIYFGTFIEGPLRYLAGGTGPAAQGLNALAGWVPEHYAWAWFGSATALATVAIWPLIHALLKRGNP